MISRHLDRRPKRGDWKTLVAEISVILNLLILFFFLNYFTRHFAFGQFLLMFIGLSDLNGKAFFFFFCLLFPPFLCWESVSLCCPERPWTTGLKQSSGLSILWGWLQACVAVPSLCLPLDLGGHCSVLPQHSATCPCSSHRIALKVAFFLLLVQHRLTMNILESST